MEKAGAHTLPSWPTSVSTREPVVAFHRRVDPSSPLVATSEPSGLKAPPMSGAEAPPWRVSSLPL